MGHAGTGCDDIFDLLILGAVHACCQGGSVGPHESGDIGSGDLATSQQLEGTQNGIVEEGPTLNHHNRPQGVGITQLDDLIQGVSDHRIAESRSDVLRGGTLLLGLLYRRVHEDRAT